MARPRVTYSKRATVTTGSKPIVASAPIAAITTAITTSRTTWRKRTAGTVAITASTAETTQVRTAAPVRSASSSLSTTTTPSTSARRPTTTGRPPVRAASAQEYAVAIGDRARTAQPGRAELGDAGDQDTEAREHDDDHEHDRHAGAGEALPAGAHAVRGPSPPRGRSLGTTTWSGPGHERSGYRRRFASEGLVLRAVSRLSRSSVAVRTAASSPASASTSPSGSTTSEWPE